MPVRFRWTIPMKNNDRLTVDNCHKLDIAKSIKI